MRLPLRRSFPSHMAKAASPTAPELSARQDMDVELPSVEGLLAGTLALMTGYAQRAAGLRGQGDVDLMAKKIASNLHFLKTHPCLSLPFAAVLGNLQLLWADLCAQTVSREPQPGSMWHGASASMQ